MVKRSHLRKAVAFAVLIVAATLAFVLFDPSWPVCMPHPIRGKTPAYWIAVLDTEKKRSHEDSLRNWDRLNAAEVLGEMGPWAKPAIPALIRALRSRDPLLEFTGGSKTGYDLVPGKARKALVRIGPKAIPSLREALSSEDALTRVHAAWALWNLSKRVEDVLPTLLAEMNDPPPIRDYCICYAARDALAEIGKVDPATVTPVLSSAVAGEDENGACAAAKVLRQMGPAAEAAVPALLGTFQGSRPEVTRQAGFALRAIGRAALPALIVSLKDADPQVRRTTAWTLMGMVSSDKALVAALVEALSDSDAETRESAADALRSIDFEAARRAGLQ
jgi:HEAT repeat protein